MFTDGNFDGWTNVGKAVRGGEDVVPVDQGPSAEELVPLPQDDGEGEALEIHPVCFITDTSNLRVVRPFEFPYMVHATSLI